MTCHHRTQFNVPDQSNSARRLPMHTVGHPRRCRCQAVGQPADHCHQEADGEDMICKYCRDRCKRGLDCTQYINISDTDIKCHPATPFCPDWLFKEKT